MKTMSLTEQDGLTYVKYSGNRSASFSIWGPSTGTQYRVNPKNPVFLVDNNDLYSKQGNRLTGLLDVYEGTKYAFELYKKAEPVKVEVETVEEVLPSIQDTFETTMYENVNGSEATVEEEEIVELYEDVSLTDKHFEALETVSKLRVFMLNETFSLAELELMLEYEKTNKNRISAIDMINLNIDQYDGSTLVMSSDIQNY